MYQYSYALEKFNRAIYTLSTAEGDVRKRLHSAFSDELLMIASEHLPNKLRKDFEWAKKELTKYDETYEGQKKVFKTKDGRLDNYLPARLDATCQRIKNSSGAKVAKKVFHIWQVLNEESSK
jgi:hypothetical protein